MEDATMAKELRKKLAKDAMEELSSALDDFVKYVKVPGQIRFPIEVSSVRTLEGQRPGAPAVGSWCSVRPCQDDKTYLGVYLGDLTVSVDHYYHTREKVLTIAPHANPALYVPDLKRVVWGCESWWGTIEGPEHLRQITDADIQDLWYVKALKDLAGKPAEGGAECPREG
jgi:hypothetical protein